jgi:hypothetical protein
MQSFEQVLSGATMRAKVNGLGEIWFSEAVGLYSCAQGWSVGGTLIAQVKPDGSYLMKI